MSHASIRCTTLEVINWRSWRAYQGADELAVFRCQLPYALNLPHSLLAMLSADELDRLQRYRRDVDRSRFAYARGLLRLLVGSRSGQDPKEVRLGVGTKKKPYLPDNPALHFNVSHAGYWILIAIAKSEVGVDVENVKADFDFQDILPTSFSEKEQKHIATSENAPLRFYQLWTCKEALIKATSKGIDDDFNQIPALDGEHHIQSSLLGAEGNWVVEGFEVAENYVGAIAHQASIDAPQFYTIDSDF